MWKASSPRPAIEYATLTGGSLLWPSFSWVGSCRVRRPGALEVAGWILLQCSGYLRMILAVDT